VELFDGWRQSSKSFEQDTLAEHADAARDYMDSYLEDVERIQRGDFNAYMNAPITSMVVRALLAHISETMPIDRCLKMVMDFLVSEHFWQTPFHDLSARIYATVKAMVKDGAYTNAQDAVKRLSGFFYDVEHVATYGPYCDAFVADQSMAALLAKPTIAISQRYGVKIFSLNNWNEMLTWLDRLEHGMSDEHNQALVQAYPSLARS
jgi:hypothetical protein